MIFQRSRVKILERKLGEECQRLEVAVAKAAPRDRSSTRASEGVIASMLYEELMLEKTRAFRVKAGREPLNYPEMGEADGYWESSTFFGGWFLTDKGLHLMGEELFKARTRRFELWSRWVLLLTGVISSLGGVLIGIISVL